ncbi:hypothetical protein FTUN_5221 [Frigoriglobus tundricola]|uniref:Uncharacterized protein n=1 Tax=Frigoriglobus tundricola TaxID=2774151 RepID=A0A6M5YVY4_9BACT|nr:hypothetical protein FTUN_5221 [Frigoriglobus tundricola]
MFADRIGRAGYGRSTHIDTFETSKRVKRTALAEGRLERSGGE